MLLIFIVPLFSIRFKEMFVPFSHISLSFVLKLFKYFEYRNIVSLRYRVAYSGLIHSYKYGVVEFLSLTMAVTMCHCQV